MARAGAAVAACQLSDPSRPLVANVSGVVVLCPPWSACGVGGKMEWQSDTKRRLWVPRAPMPPVHCLSGPHLVASIASHLSSAPRHRSTVVIGRGRGRSCSVRRRCCNAQRLKQPMRGQKTSSGGRHKAAPQRWQFVLLLATMVLVTQTTTTKANPPSNERAVLMDLYHATNGPSWSSNLGWGTDKPVCDWAGITCKSGLMRM